MHDLLGALPEQLERDVAQWVGPPLRGRCFVVHGPDGAGGDALLRRIPWV